MNKKRSCVWGGLTVAGCPGSLPTPHPQQVRGENKIKKLKIKTGRSLTISHHRQNRLDLGNVNLLPITIALDGEKQRQELKEFCPPPLPGSTSLPHSRSSAPPRGMGSERLQSECAFPFYCSFLTLLPCSSVGSLQPTVPSCHKNQLQPVFSRSCGCFSFFLPAVLDFAL